MHLYRPVGLHELHLIYETGMRAFPRRLPDQPIFYPVLNQAYAEQIARAWNTKSHSFVGYVTAFTIDDAYGAQFERQVVGGPLHEEFWVPAEEVPLFNQHIHAPITVTTAYFGTAFTGYQPTQGVLAGCPVREQFVALVEQWRTDPDALVGEVRTNNVAIYLHYRFWEDDPEVQDTIPEPHRTAVLQAIRNAWQQISPVVQLF